MAAKIQTFRDPLTSVAMASMQCHKPANETCQQKCNDKSLGHKVSDTVHKAADVVHKAMKGNHRGHGTGHHPASSQTHCYGQTQTYSHHASHGMASHGKTEKKMKEKKSEHKKKSNCSDSDSSSSGSDSD